MQKESSRFEKIRERLHLQNFSNYIRHGSEDRIVCFDSYEHREQQAECMLLEFLEAKFGEEEAEIIRDKIDMYINVIEEITFSLGMKSGAMLMQALLGNFESDT